MRRLIAACAAFALFAIVGTSALADSTPPVAAPFPASSVGQLFVAGQTVDSTGAMSSWFAPGATVVFRALALDTKSLKTLGAKDVTYFYVTIPNQPNVKMTFNPAAPGATARFPWTGKWTVPANYPSGIVAFKMLVKSVFKRHGSFVQIPVATSDLTISPTAPAPYGSGPAASASATSLTPTSDLGVYVDTVNGSAPVGVARRPIGCSQTNVFKRGEQVVFRVWGFDLKSGDTLSTDNVDTATATIPGVATPLTLTYGPHGATGAKVFFWSTPWILPATFPLGDVTVHVAFKTVAGKTGAFDYALTVVPS